MSVDQRPEIENLLAEGRTFPPDPAFSAQANAQPSLYDEAARDPEAFWARIARETVTWNEPFTTTLEWDLPFAKWFVGGKLNISENCVDRHVANGLGEKVAYHWIGEPGDTRTITFNDLHREVQKAANALRELGVDTGDRVAIYMPMIPELPIAMLACARIGAPHTVVFAGFSAEALSGRINDAEAKLVITADGSYRRGKAMPLKAAVDEAVAASPSVEKVLMVRRLGDAAPETTVVKGRDVWWDEIVERQAADCPPVPLDSEHMLYLLYTSGTTAKPKGIIHTTAGYLVGT
ncbi:MAG TPA: AMP-binding protein, partial [Candidatus Limnocylindrales bacterium]